MTTGLLAGLLLLVSPPPAEMAEPPGPILAAAYLPGPAGDQIGYRISVYRTGLVTREQTDRPIDSGTPEFLWVEAGRPKQVKEKQVKDLLDTLRSVDFLKLQARYAATHEIEPGMTHFYPEGPTLRLAACLDVGCQEVEISSPMDLVGDHDHPHRADGRRFMTVWAKALALSGPLRGHKAKDYQKYTLEGAEQTHAGRGQ